MPETTNPQIDSLGIPYIDMEAVRQRIKQRGYKTQISAEDKPFGKQ